MFILNLSLLAGIVSHIVIEESKLSIRMVEEVLDSLEIPDEDDVEVERSEIHETISLVFFVKVPNEVHRVFSGLLSDQLVDMSDYGEGEAWGGEGGVSCWFEKVISEK